MKASYTYTTTTGTAPLNVQFTDTSSGNPTSWEWVFGDGGYSTEQNPEHTYVTEGVYSVELTVSDGVSYDYIIKVGLIGVYRAGYKITRPYVSHIGNGNFQEWESGTPKYWEKFTWSNGISQSTDCKLGICSLRIDGDSTLTTGGGIWQGLTTGDNYEKAGCWIKITGMTQGALIFSLWDGTTLFEKEFTHNCDWMWFEWRIPFKNEYQWADTAIYTKNLNTGASIFINGLVLSQDGYYHSWEWEDTNLLSRGLIFTPDKEYVFATLLLTYDTFDIGCYKTELTTCTLDNVNYPVTFNPYTPGGQIWLDVSNLDTDAHDIEVYTTYSDVGRYTTYDGLLWKGFNWWGRRGQGAPLFNRWASYGVYVDYLDRLHLTVKPIDGVWYSSEVDGEVSFMYGTFRWVIDSAPFYLDDNLVLGLYTYGNDVNEHDFEFTTWWGNYNTNVWISNQPNAVWVGELHPFEKVECILEWYESYCRYTIKTLSGESLVDCTITDFPSSTIPEGLSMNLWQYCHPTNYARADIIIYDFEAAGYSPFDYPLTAELDSKSNTAQIEPNAVYTAIFDYVSYHYPLSAEFENTTNTAIINPKIYTVEFNQ